MIKLINECKEYVDFIRFIVNIKIKLIILICTLNLLATCLSGITIPYISKYLMDNVMVNKDLNVLYNAVIVILVIYMVYLISDVLLSYITIKWKTDIDFTVKCNFYGVINQKAMTELAKVSPMDLFYRMFNDGQIMTEYLYTIFITIPCSIMFCVIIFYIMLKWSKILSVYTLILVVINLISILVLQKPIKKVNKLLKSVNQNVADYVIEKLEFISFSQMNYISKWWENMVQCRFDYAKKVTIKNTFVMKILNNLTELIRQLWSVGFIIIGVYLIVKKDLTLGAFFGFQSLAIYFIMPLNNLVIGIYSFQDTKVSYERYKEYYNLKNIENGNIKGISKCKKMEFNNIKFSYPNSDRIIFKDFSAVFKSGTMTSIIGDNGKGKSTLMLMAARLLSPEKGEIKIDDILIHEISFDNYYELIAFMPQSSVVFNDSFINNLVLDKKYSRNQIKEVMEACSLNQIVNRLPNKIESVLGKDGVNLSVGEARRLALARILLKHPQIIWLDEPTTSIDEESLIHIVSALKEFGNKYNMITIVNTHSDFIIEKSDYHINI